MGEVYRAVDTYLGRTVALKLLPERFAADPERLERFHREARAASALNHPNIVTIFDAGISGQKPWIAMELVDGRTLRSLLGDGVPLSRVVPSDRDADGRRAGKGARSRHRAP
jgi:eukaryotic-like serine/threonine-protein kinase